MPPSLAKISKDPAGARALASMIAATNGWPPEVTQDLLTRLQHLQGWPWTTDREDRAAWFFAAAELADSYNLPGASSIAGTFRAWGNGELGQAVHDWDKSAAGQAADFAVHSANDLRKVGEAAGKVLDTAHAGSQAAVNLSQAAENFTDAGKESSLPWLVGLGGIGLLLALLL